MGRRYFSLISSWWSGRGKLFQLKSTEMMRKLIKLTCLVLILLMLANTITASAAEGFSGEKALKIGAITVVVGVFVYCQAVSMEERINSTSKERPCRRRRLGGAVRAYTQAWEINPNYKDVTTKLATAKERRRVFTFRG